jgi:4-hydroxy-3-methylbut-2-enyl diphosphate reductase
MTSASEEMVAEAREPAEAQTRETEQGDYEATFRALSPGDIVTGTVVRMDERGALVDVGTKSEGLIPQEEARDAKGPDEKPLAVGDRIAVYVVKPEGEDGQLVLSKKKADYEAVWNRVMHAYETGQTISAMVTERVRGGLVVDLGLRGFLPASHVASKNVRALDRLVGQSLRLKVVEVDRARKRVVVSHKLAAEEERKRRRESTLSSLQEGQERKAIVRRITDYGAFLDLGGVDGLLHVTEMSWTRVRHPSDIVKPGQKLEVVVLKVDREQEKISLGLKQILPDPWQHVGDQYKIGDVVEGKITRLVPFGAFCLLPAGIEGIIPTSELSGQRNPNPGDVVRVDQTVRVKILSVRPAERRMTLSLRQVEQDKERREYQEYLAKQEQAGRVTIGDVVGEAFARAGQQANPEPGEDQCFSSASPEESEAEKAQPPSSSD